MFKNFILMMSQILEDKILSHLLINLCCNVLQSVAPSLSTSQRSSDVQQYRFK